MHKIFVTSILLIVSVTTNCQSFFDDIESHLKDKISFSFGVQLTYFKDSHIYFEQSQYDRKLHILDVKGNGRIRFDTFIKGEIGTTQYRMDLKYKLNPKYSIQLEWVHLDYFVDLDREYYQRGTWNNERVNYTGDLTSKFTLIEHSNGINILKLGLGRKILFDPASKFELSTGLQLGLVYSGTQANIYSPFDDIEKFDAGNTFVGANYSSNSEFGYRISSRLSIFFNFTYFQMNLNNALIDKGSFVSQKLSGSNYGLNIRFSI